MATQRINWSGSFVFPHMTQIKSPGDGSCLIHSLLRAYNRNYREERRNNRYVSRKELVRNLRNELANLLSSPLDPLNPRGNLYYDILSRGRLDEISREFPKLTLDSMQETLRSNASLDYMFFELIGDYLDKDIYILDGKNRDVYVTSEEDLYQRGRPSIVLLFNNKHYDLVGIQEEDASIRTLFNPDDEFISALRGRQNILKRKA